MNLGAFSRVFAVAGGILVLSAPVALSAENVPAAFEARYETLRIAIVGRDEAAIRAMLAPGFVSVEIDGKLQTADQMIASLVGQPRDSNKRYATTIESVRVTGDTAVVEQRYDMTTRRPDADGSMHDQRVTAQSTDAWVRLRGAWLCRRTMTNEVWVYRDGKLTRHLKRPVT